MKPTCEQLELAAKAAGLPAALCVDEYGYFYFPDSTCECWNPVVDKNNSSDLMVDCEINIAFFNDCVKAFFVDATGYGWFKDHNHDRGEATRWAIFLCAVEIGRAM